MFSYLIMYVERFLPSFFGMDSAVGKRIFAAMREPTTPELKAAKQLRYDLAYLRLAREWAKLSHCKRKQVGAIIVKDATIIADGYNGTPTGFEN